ncbi:MAG: bifunctional 23S rRNA (guanine(2069)-N(7))-methyltransferase RlmK/23S rRNA (guanine(2445)-N(2))-methyltransferase RlmL [Gammaproteobacteria bacterium]
MQNSYFVTVPQGLEFLLRKELEAFGIQNSREGNGGVFFDGTLEQGYRLCLWSRIANRVLLKLDSFSCTTQESLYEGIGKTDWSLHLKADASFAVVFSGTSEAIRNSHFGALKVKDAIVDQFRIACGRRPSISIRRPDLRITVRLSGKFATLYLDLSGDSLHKRAYRLRGGKAPLKENLAAAILFRAGWPEIFARGGSFLDPMCGSGTFLIEAAMIAGDIAPGLQRDYFGFLGWKGHDADSWERLVQEALRRKNDSLAKLPPIVGFDIDPDALRLASENIRRAGLEKAIRVERGSAGELTLPPSMSNPGLIAVNPPYGERIDAIPGVGSLYADFGRVLRSRFIDWRVAMLVQDAELGFRIGIRSRRPLSLHNGSIECKLLIFDVVPERFLSSEGSDSGSRTRTKNPESPHFRSVDPGHAAEARASMFANRLRKNLRHLGKWAERQGISCYRVYDADIPEYALAIDLYRGDALWVHVQEYQAPSSIDPELAERRLVDALSVIPEVLQVDPGHIFFKVRRRQKGKSQYTRNELPRNFYVVEEAGLRFQVNLESYLDTGLFLDHRLTRDLIRRYSPGRRFLNLFGYTGSATVYAAAGGATSTVTVDWSGTYLDWARRNLILNGFDSAGHQLIQENVLSWITRTVDKAGRHPQFELIFLDPPTFSNSKGWDNVFDVQRDHAALIERTCRLLAPGGILIFSTNSRKFKLEQDCLSGLNIVDISRTTLPRDFERNPGIHRCWEIRKD